MVSIYGVNFRGKLRGDLRLRWSPWGSPATWGWTADLGNDEGGTGWRMTWNTPQETDTYPTIWKGKSSTQKCLRMGYVSSQQGIFEKTWLILKWPVKYLWKTYKVWNDRWNIFEKTYRFWNDLKYLENTYEFCNDLWNILEKTNMNSEKTLRCVHHVSVPRGDDTHVQQNNDSPQINFHLQFSPFRELTLFFFLFCFQKLKATQNSWTVWQTWNTDLQKNKVVSGFD